MEVDFLIYFCILSQAACLLRESPYEEWSFSDVMILGVWLEWSGSATIYHPLARFRSGFT